MWVGGPPSSYPTDPHASQTSGGLKRWKKQELPRVSLASATLWFTTYVGFRWYMVFRGQAQSGRIRTRHNQSAHNFSCGRAFLRTSVCDKSLEVLTCAVVHVVPCDVVARGSCPNHEHPFAGVFFGAFELGRMDHLAFEIFLQHRHHQSGTSWRRVKWSKPSRGSLGYTVSPQSPTRRRRGPDGTPCPWHLVQSGEHELSTRLTEGPFRPEEPRMMSTRLVPARKRRTQANLRTVHRRVSNWVEKPRPYRRTLFEGTKVGQVGGNGIYGN